MKKTINQQIATATRRLLAEDSTRSTGYITSILENSGYNKNTARRVIGEVRKRLLTPSPNLSDKQKTTIKKRWAEQLHKTERLAANGKRFREYIYQPNEKIDGRVLFNAERSKYSWAISYELLLVHEQTEDEIKLGIPPKRSTEWRTGKVRRTYKNASGERWDELEHTMMLDTYSITGVKIEGVGMRLLRILIDSGLNKK